MSNITTFNFNGEHQRTMSSREIAEITGKRHKHVLADIRKMLEELDLSSTDFATQYKDSTGRMQPCFNLPKRETMILVSGYSIPVLEKMIDRWEALETGKAVPAMVARIVDRWEALETGVATPSAVPTNRASEDMVVLSALADALRLEGSARLGVMRKGMEIVAPHLLPAVPVWA